LNKQICKNIAKIVTTIRFYCRSDTPTGTNARYRKAARAGEHGPSFAVVLPMKSEHSPQEQAPQHLNRRKWFAQNSNLHNRQAEAKYGSK